MSTHLNKKNSLCLTLAEVLVLGNFSTPVWAWLSLTFVLKVRCFCLDIWPVFRHMMTYCKPCDFFSFGRKKSSELYRWHLYSLCKNILCTDIHTYTHAYMGDLLERLTGSSSCNPTRCTRLDVSEIPIWSPGEVLESRWSWVYIGILKKSVRKQPQQQSRWTCQ